MITLKTLTFLKQLKQNNTKEWMDSHRDIYEVARQNFEEFVAAILDGMSSVEPSFADLKPKHCIFRINRDIRFSKDKSPYKNNFGAAFSKGGKKSPYADYYFHLEPGNSFLAGGLWMPDAARLKGIRQEIDYGLEDFRQIVNNKAFRKIFPNIEGEQLKNAPSGYAIDNPAIEYLRYKSFTVGHSVEDKKITGGDIVKYTLQSYITMKPFLDFLNRSVDS